MSIEAPLLDQLRARRFEAQNALESLGVCRQRVDEHFAKLESAKAAAEYLDTFLDLLTRAVHGLDAIIDGGEPARPRTAADTLRRLAADAERLEPTCREFSDRWVQKPLPFEEVRPLLTQMVSVARHQLSRLRALEDVAARISASAPPPEASRFDRRGLFSRLADPLRRRE